MGGQRWIIGWRLEGGLDIWLAGWLADWVGGRVKERTVIDRLLGVWRSEGIPVRLKPLWTFVVDDKVSVCSDLLAGRQSG